jgi:DNA-binding LytR/AlgR family response regulator
VIRALVVDDEPLARQRLIRLLAEHADVEVVAEAGSGAEAVRASLRERPDVVFLDVQMPGQDGLKALRSLHDHLPEDVRPAVVFTTAHEEHAVEAFALEGTDYLLKPVEPQALARALRRVRRQAWGPRHAGAETAASSPPRDTAARAPEAPRPGGPPPAAAVGHVAVKHAGTILRLALEDIACVVVDDTITWAQTATARYDMGVALHEAERRLPSPPFVQVSRSAIVNVAWIDHLSPGDAGTFTAVLRAPLRLEVEVSRRRARELRDLLGF